MRRLTCSMPRVRTVLLAGLVALAALASAEIARAGDGRIHVVLVDGTEVQGDLVEKVPGDHLTIALATGEVRTIPWASIHSMDAVSPSNASAPAASDAPVPSGPSAFAPWAIAAREVTWPRPDRSRPPFEGEHVYAGVTAGIGTPTGYAGVALAWDPSPWFELEAGAGLGGRFGYAFGAMARLALPLLSSMRMGFGVGLSENVLTAHARGPDGEWPGAPTTSQWLNVEFVQNDFMLGKTGFLRLSVGFAFLLNRGDFAALCPETSKDVLSKTYDAECVEGRPLPATPKTVAGDTRAPFVPYVGLAFFWRLT
jgi:hypothetical protein